jgi:DNA-binding beta-propeller fold protein YncE
MPNVRQFGAVAAVLCTIACGHAPEAARQTAVSPAEVWPPPPALARARLVAVLPDPGAPPRPRAWWVRALEWITGGTIGDDPGAGLERPFGVAVGPDGGVVVADPDSGRVFRMESAGAVEPVACSTPRWSAPMAVAFGGDGAIYVADAGLAAVVRVRGKECSVIGLGAFERPTGLVVIGERIFVVDPPRHQVIALSLDGQTVARWGSQGASDGQFAFPSSIAVAQPGSLVITDALNFRIARIGTDGAWISSFGTPGEEGAGFARPKGIATDDEGRIYVSDAQRDTVLVFSGDGHYEYSIGEPGEGPGQLALPSGLTVARNRLYVADSQNRRIQVFELLGGRP